MFLVCFLCLSNPVEANSPVKNHTFDVEQTLVSSAVWAVFFKLVTHKDTSWTRAIGAGLLFSFHQALVSENSASKEQMETSNKFEIPVVHFQDVDLPFAREVDEKPWTIDCETGEWFYRH